MAVMARIAAPSGGARTVVVPTALVTGALGGLGSAIAARLAADGFRIAYHDIVEQSADDYFRADLLHRLEEQGRREKAIVITAYGSAENAVEALKAGAYDYLTKPVDLKQFRAIVNYSVPLL